MRPTAGWMIAVLLFATLAASVAWSSAGNALTGGSSYVGPAGAVARPAPPRRVQQATGPAAPVSALRIPLRNAAPYPTPTVSPYVNMFRPDASRIFNYYTLVKPQMAQLRINQERAAQIQALEQTMAPPRGGGDSAGRRFMGHSNYFGTSR